jgi:hypothetical protein
MFDFLLPFSARLRPKPERSGGGTKRGTRFSLLDRAAYCSLGDRRILLVNA